MRSDTHRRRKEVKIKMGFFFDRVLLLILLFSCIILAQFQPDSPRSYYCLGGYYNPNSSYRSNLNLLLSSLSSSSSNSTINGGFYNTSIGQEPDNKVYGLFLCRGDVIVDPQECQSCVETVGKQITKRCPFSKIAIAWDDLCMLRYSNTSIFSKMEQMPAPDLENPNDVSDPVAFNKTLGTLLNGVVSKAASSSGSGSTINTTNPPFFATGDARVNNVDHIYALVQCTPDISRSDCNVCLRQTVNRIPVCCNGKKGATMFRPSCSVRFELNPFYGQFTSTNTTPAVASPPPPLATNNNAVPNGSASGSSSIKVAIVIPSVIGSIFLLAILVSLLMYMNIKKTRRKKRGKMNSKLDDEIGNVESLQFDLDTILGATDNFSSANRLGQGGFGAVYKGKLIDGQEIAVKRLCMHSGQGSQEFKNEVMLLLKLQHRNLVRLLGFCLEGDEKLLIYEFVPNTSLDKYLFDPTKKAYLDWETRYKIIGGIARGLIYLHEDSRLKIIHRDLKAGNILLDGEMNPKISDFGMAKLFVVDQTQGNTSRIAGTFGYMAPEYALHGVFSVKSDVFSFGILLLEIIGGQKITNYQHSSSGPSKDLLSITWKLWREGSAKSLLELVDPSLDASCSSNEIIRCIHIALLCVQENIEARPTVSAVVLMLNTFSLTLPSPSSPPLVSTTDRL